MGRSLKKGPFVAAHLSRKIDKMNASGGARPIKTWARASMIVPGFRRAHVPGPQRQDLQQRVRHRKHGRPQAGRVFPDAHLQETRRAHRQSHQVTPYLQLPFMRGSAWRLAAACPGTAGLLSAGASGRQGPPPGSPASRATTDPRVSASPADSQPTRPQSLKQQLKETQDRLHAYEAENEALRRRNDQTQGNDPHPDRKPGRGQRRKRGVPSPVRRDERCGWRRSASRSVGDNKEALEQRLLQAVRDLALVRDEKDKLAERLVALSETVHALHQDGQQSATPSCAWRSKPNSAQANKAVDDAAGKDAGGEPRQPRRPISNGRGVERQGGILAHRRQPRQPPGREDGMPFLVARDGSLVAKARVVDVRERDQRGDHRGIRFQHGKGESRRPDARGFSTLQYGSNTQDFKTDTTKDKVYGSSIGLSRRADVGLQGAGVDA